jgi:hypothetical protein
VGIFCNMAIWDWLKPKAKSLLLFWQKLYWSLQPLMPWGNEWIMCLATSSTDTSLQPLCS